MSLWLGAYVERLRSSLFFVPMVFVVGSVLLAEASLTVDEALIDRGLDLPLRLTSTVESARSVLSTVASATMTFAGIAFSVALLVFQLASSQYSPRVVHDLFRDPFNKVVMGVVVGTFTYCLLVLRTVRSALESGSQPIVPNLSVGIAVLLGIGAVLSIVAFINHAAHQMDVSQILEGVVGGTLERVDGRGAQHSSALLADAPTGEGFVVRFDRNGWIQQVDDERLLGLVPAGGTVRLETVVGRYAIAGTRLCTIWPVPRAADRDRVVDEALAAVHTGDTRTMQQDAAYGLRQVVDVALRALSPGVNDPTTAQDAIFHATALLRALLLSPLDRVVPGEGGRRLLVPEVQGPDELIGLAYDEVRLAAAGLPTVCTYLLESMSLLSEALRSEGLGALEGAVRRQADMLLVAAEGAGLPGPDLERVRSAHRRRFPDAGDP